MQGFAINPDILNSYAVQSLSPRAFRRAFYAALRGATNEFTPFVRRWNGRPELPEWESIRSRIFARDDYTCTYCGHRGGKLQCDHIIPVSKGGSHTDDNLTTACGPCNMSKGAKLLSEWRQ